MDKLPFKLTTRQTEVAHMMLEGLTYRQIAFEIGIARDTVKRHVYSMRKKVLAQGGKPTSRKLPPEVRAIFHGAYGIYGQQVDPFVRSLDRIQRRILKLFGKGCTRTEIARRMRMNRQQLNWRLEKIRANLRRNNIGPSSPGLPPSLAALYASSKHGRPKPEKLLTEYQYFVFDQLMNGRSQTDIAVQLGRIHRGSISLVVKRIREALVANGVDPTSPRLSPIFRKRMMITTAAPTGTAPDARFRRARPA